METKETNNTKNKIQPLGRSIFFVSLIFILFLCIVISFATYKIFTNSMYDRYQKQLKSIVDYAESHIDVDDMSECSRTYVESEKYKEFQAFFDNMIDHYEDVHYLYIMQVIDPDAEVNVREICAANSTYEKTYEPENVLHLGDGQYGWYDAETARTIQKIQEGDEDVYFVNGSEWGVDYTLARPLVDSTGRHFAVLCADVSIDEINAAVYLNIYIIIGVIASSGIIFGLLLIAWMRANVTEPLQLVEQSVVDLAAKSAGLRNPEELVYNPPVLKSNNEVKALSNAVGKLSADMRDYINAILTAEKETDTLKTHVNEMNAIAYQDALTKVKNKAAYDQKCAELEQDIADNKAEFAIVMLDINRLKQVNDTYGHEAGDEYLIGASRIICETFKHSPVYRIGGDEFAVILQGQDYKNRDKLFKQYVDKIEQTSHDEAVEPWQRFSAAAGMSEFVSGDEVVSVFNRADKAMYKAKAEMESER